MLNRNLSIFAVATLCLTLFGCGGSPTDPNTEWSGDKGDQAAAAPGRTRAQECSNHWTNCMYDCATAPSKQNEKEWPNEIAEAGCFDACRVWYLSKPCCTNDSECGSAEICYASICAIDPNHAP